MVVGASRFLYKELLREEEGNGHLPRITINHFKPTLSPDALECLVDYMYTSKYVGVFILRHSTVLLVNFHIFTSKIQIFIVKFAYIH